jgi:hypothetical protein
MIIFSNLLNIEGIMKVNRDQPSDMGSSPIGRPVDQRFKEELNDVKKELQKSVEGCVQKAFEKLSKDYENFSKEDRRENNPFK